MDKQFIRATAILVGTMIGVGVFGIPFAFAKAGFLLGSLFFVGTALVTLLMNFIYGEIVLRTSAQHQLVGYAALYEGIWAKRVIFFTVLLGTYGALLAYIIASGDFLASVFGPWFAVSAETYSALFFVVASLCVFVGLKAVSWIEVGLATLFLCIIGLIALFGVSSISIQHYTYTNIEYWFFPYGIFLFAFSGIAAIPMQRRILGAHAHQLRRSITWGVLFVACVYFIFGVTVAGISGEATSPEAIQGLVDFVSDDIILLGSLFGALAVTTSFLMLGSSLLEVFRLDYRMHRVSSWLFVVVPPALLYWGGLRSFIEVISLVGSVAIGVESAILLWMYRTAQKKGDRVPEFSVQVPRVALYLLGVIFIGAAVYELFF